MLDIGEEYKNAVTQEDFLKCKEYRECVKKHPERVMLVMLCTIYEGISTNKTTLHDYFGRYSRNSRLENWYALLTRVGYIMGSDERRLLSGAHECFSGL